MASKKRSFTRIDENGDIWRISKKVLDDGTVEEIREVIGHKDITVEATAEVVQPPEEILRIKPAPPLLIVPDSPPTTEAQEIELSSEDDYNPLSLVEEDKIPPAPPVSQMDKVKTKIGLMIETVKTKIPKKTSDKPLERKAREIDETVGTLDNPYRPINAYDEWHKLTFDGFVYLRTVSYNEEKGWYEMTEDMIRKKNLPEHAVHCSFESKYYMLDTINRKWPYHDQGFSALDACLYMKNNKINNALAFRWGAINNIDPKLIIVALLGIGVIVMWMVLR